MLVDEAPVAQDGRKAPGHEVEFVLRSDMDLLAGTARSQKNGQAQAGGGQDAEKGKRTDRHGGSRHGAEG